MAIGKPDLVVANQGSGHRSVLSIPVASGLIAAGSFAAKVDVTNSTNPHSVAIGMDGMASRLGGNNYSSNTISVCAIPVRL